MKGYSYIRFSTPEQSQGDSLRRQVEQTEAYCKARGLTLDDSLHPDCGLSGYHGEHRVRGSLGQFLRLVEQGEIEPGSVLLVESLDRLSRQAVLDALSQFTQIIGAGVTVVTLADGMSYDRDSINANFGQLLMSLVIMSRAHEESATKAHRIRAVWETKRKAANDGKKMTSICPHWLKLKNGKFEVIPEAAAAINKIFELRLAGKGVSKITYEMNQNGNWKPSKGWREAYIRKLLHNNRALLGEFQPQKRVEGGGRVNVGEPIPNYFPAIMDPDLYNQVQAAIQQNRQTGGNGGGRVGPVSNLFSHIGRCGRCGGAMAYIAKGQGKKSYLVCDTARLGLGCNKVHIRYDVMEPLILSYCKGLEPSEILPDGGKSELALLRGKLQGAEGELSQVERKITTLLSSLEDADTPEYVKLIKSRVQEHTVRQVELTELVGVLRDNIARVSIAEADTHRQLQSTRELLDRMSELEGQDRGDLRLSLRSQLRQLIHQMNFFPDLSQVGVIFKTGERRLLILEGDKVRLLDVLPGAKKMPSQLWGKPV